MNQDELKNAIDIFYPALIFDRLINRRLRHLVKNIFGIIFLIPLFLEAVYLVLSIKKLQEFLPIVSVWYDKFTHFDQAILGMLMIFLSLWLICRAFEAYYDSFYFSGFATVLPESGLSNIVPLITFEASSAILEGVILSDFTRGFVTSRLGRFVLIRLGISDSVSTDFFSKRVSPPDPGIFSIPPKTLGKQINLRNLASTIFTTDHEFAKFLSLQNVSPTDLAGAASWVEYNEIALRRHERFWGKDSLGRIPGLGKDWAYGGAYSLEKFGHDITDRGLFDQNEESKEFLAELDELEAILARSGESNALLVADEGAGALDIVFGLGTRISRGSVLPPLEHKRIVLFDVNGFIADAKDKAHFETQLLHIFGSCVRSGNIILVFSDLPSFVENSRSIGSDLITLIDPFLASPHLQFIAMANTGAFHLGLEGDSKILHRFEKILIKDRDEKAVFRTLEDVALRTEARSGVFFTYQSIAAVVDGAKRYFTDGVVSDKAVHLLGELIPAVQSKHKKFIERSDVLALIGVKTGIPTGDVTSEERDKLLNLEKVLGQRIIGQDDAVKAISNAMRRARSNIENPNRPMGSFLFLGPTGVGKTETTKALADTFFGKENAIIRLDMSEYRTDDALARLIGSFEGGRVGVLSAKLREQSYGVLLLDEFEKTSKDVLDLFLQILDEGFFSDMAGHRVNARNLIIIATSNAGSDLIWRMLRGTDAEAESGTYAEKKLDKNSIINEIINRGIFKPELLNRFDGVILFHPLQPDTLQKIAVIMLETLRKRLADEKQIELVVNDALVKAVTLAGTDPEFGARPMNRAIAEKVEQVIARKIIAGEATAGSRIELTEAELA